METSSTPLKKYTEGTSLGPRVINSAAIFREKTLSQFDDHCGHVWNFWQNPRTARPAAGARNGYIPRFRLKFHILKVKCIDLRPPEAVKTGKKVLFDWPNDV